MSVGRIVSSSDKKVTGFIWGYENSRYHAYFDFDLLGTDAHHVFLYEKLAVQLFRNNLSLAIFPDALEKVAERYLLSAGFRKKVFDLSKILSCSEKVFVEPSRRGSHVRSIKKVCHFLFSISHPRVLIILRDEVQIKSAENELKSLVARHLAQLVTDCPILHEKYPDMFGAEDLVEIPPPAMNLKSGRMLFFDKKSPRIAVLGSPRKEKGYRLLLAALNSVPNLNAQIVIQAHDIQRDVYREVEELSRFENVRLIRHSLSGSEYSSLLAESEYVLVCNDPRVYSARTSSVINDAVSFERFLLVEKTLRPANAKHCLTFSYNPRCLAFQLRQITRRMSPKASLRSLK